MQGNYDLLYYGWWQITASLVTTVKKPLLLFLNTAPKKYGIPVFPQFQTVDIIN